jgi:hypothetical protein
MEILIIDIFSRFLWHGGDDNWARCAVCRPLKVAALLVMAHDLSFVTQRRAVKKAQQSQDEVSIKPSFLEMFGGVVC